MCSSDLFPSHDSLILLIVYLTHMRGLRLQIILGFSTLSVKRLVLFTCCLGVVDMTVMCMSRNLVLGRVLIVLSFIIQLVSIM